MARSCCRMTISKGLMCCGRPLPFFVGAVVRSSCKELQIAVFVDILSGSRASKSKVGLHAEKQGGSPGGRWT